MHPLKEIRKTRNMTQAELGDLVGLSRFSISHLECGRRKGPVEVWQKLASVLDAKPEDLWRQGS